MVDNKMFYWVQFVSNGEYYELYVWEVFQGGLFGFVEIGDFVWDNYSYIVVDFFYEKFKIEFVDVISIFILMYNVFRIDQVKK